MKSAILNFLRDEEGATAIEYGLIAALIAVVAIAAMTSVGGSLSGIFTNIADTLSGSGADKAPADPPANEG
ncbi:MAG: Flp family type IVb pilin [Comamonas sp.]